MSTAGLSVVAKTWKQSRHPSTQQTNKLWYIHAMKYYSALKKKKQNELWCHEKIRRDLKWVFKWKMHHMIPTTDILEMSNSKWQNCGDLKKTVIARGRRCGDRNEYMEHEISMKNTLYNTIIDRYMPLYICLNHRIEHHEWTLM